MNQRAYITYGSKFNGAAFVFEYAKSPLQVATSPCANFDPNSTGNKNGGCEPEVLVPEIVKFQRH